MMHSHCSGAYLPHIHQYLVDSAGLISTRQIAFKDTLTCTTDTITTISHVARAVKAAFSVVAMPIHRVTVITCVAHTFVNI